MRSESARPSSTDLSREVACPHCDRPTSVPVPDDGAELRVSPYVAAFGEYSTARCPDDHPFWIYHC